jgi:hypothetical protein
MAASSLFHAWAAGFIDGEGSFSAIAKTAKPLIHVGQRDRKPLEILVDNFGLGAISKPKPNGVSEWCVSGYDAAVVCEAILPFLRVKHEHAELVIAWAAVRSKSSRKYTYEERLAREEIARKLRMLNRQYRRAD